MNFSLLRNVYLDWHLRFLGYEDPYAGDEVLPAAPRPKPRVVTCRQVLKRLRELPDVGGLRALQARQQRARPRPGVDMTLKLFCRCGGPPLIRAFEILAGLRDELGAADAGAGAGAPDRDEGFSRHQHLVEALVEVRKSHAIWEVSVGDEAFFKKHPRPRAVRFEYLAYMLHLLYVVADLTFPDDLRDYLDEMERVLRRSDWREQLILDSDVTYERTRSRVRPEVMAPVERYPKRFLLYGQTVLRPFLVRNTSVYGHRLVANEYAMRRRKDAPKIYLNLGRLNNWDQQW